ncbi:expressed protein [Phakopsora pachyrhizi]|uniref:Expressed protein n=1 Tax=Phakopsora pachyrhizi TaxID=170000 RepID=A0AAV0AIJ0_PHAPC|nr:expressed protein [Phakopsora pachyrhizi]
MKMEIYFALKAAGLIINILYFFTFLTQIQSVPLEIEKETMLLTGVWNLTELLQEMIVINQPAQGYHLIAILKNSLMASKQPTNYHLVFKNHVCNLINTYFQ